MVLRVIVVVFEHVWSEDRVTGIASRDVEPEVAMFIDGSNLVWSSPDGLNVMFAFLRFCAY